MREVAVRGREERGAMLPLLALFLVPILAFAAIVIDAAIVANSSSDLSYQARTTALSAVQGYAESYNSQRTCSSCPTQSERCYELCGVERAATRASQAHYLNTRFGDRFVSNPSAKSNVVWYFSAHHDDEVALESEPYNPGGWMWPGQFHYTTPQGCLDCPEPPYFESFTAADLVDDSNRINAFMTRVYLPTNNPVMLNFAKLLGFSSVALKKESVAALLEGNYFFFVDLSRSIVADTYLRSNELVPGGGGAGAGGEGGLSFPGTKAEFAYQLNLERTAGCSGAWGLAVSDEDVCCPDSDSLGCVVGGDPACATKEVSADNTYLQTVTSRGFTLADYLTFADLRPQGPYAPVINGYTPTPQTTHFSRHHRCVSVDVYPHDGIEESYLIDFGSQSSPYFKSNPQPLFSVLDAIHEAMSIVKSRAQPNDKVAVFGFDDQPILEDDTSPRVMLPADPTSQTFQDMLVSLNTSDQEVSAMPQGFLGRGFFPTPFGYTDIFDALRRGAWILSGLENYQYAKNSFFLFTDGFQNCLYSYDPDAENDWWLRWTRSECVNNGEGVVQGIQTLTSTEFVDELVKRNISVSVVLVNQEGFPHILVRRNGEGTGCLTQSEDTPAGNQSGESGYGLVDSEWESYKQLLTNKPEQLNDLYADRANNAFLAPNHLYEGLVAPTSGLWVPIMEPYLYVDPIGASHTYLNFSQALEDACRAAVGKDPIPSLNLDVSLPNGQVVTIRNVTDAEGRLRYNPYGMSAAEQMRSAMEQALQSPFVVVQ